jgi:hypothetical protein
LWARASTAAASALRTSARRTNRDLVVMGTGVTSAVASGCREAGRTVAVVDWRPFGGACALRGCVPTKILIGAAEAVQGAGHADLGVTARRARIAAGAMPTPLKCPGAERVATSEDFLSPLGPHAAEVINLFTVATSACGSRPPSCSR